MNENLNKICRICTNNLENETISLFQHDELFNIQLCEKLSSVSNLKVCNYFNNFSNKKINNLISRLQQMIFYLIIYVRIVRNP